MNLSEYQRDQILDMCRIPHYTGSFIFEHGNRGYWIVKGPVPVHVAEEIYKDPASEHIRVDGHCMGVRPVAPWIKLRMFDGSQLLTLDDKAQLDKVANLGDPEFHKKYMRKFTFSDDPNVWDNAQAYVELYHIDSSLGLRVFVDYLRLYNLL